MSTNHRHQARRPTSPTPGAKRRRRTGVALTAVGSLATVGAALLRWTHTLSSAALTRYGGATNIVLGVVVIGRGIVHIAGHYFNHRDPGNPKWRPAHRRKLNGLVVAEILGGVYLIVVGVALMLSDPHPWRGLVLTLPAWPVGWYIADQKLALAKIADLPTGTMIVRDCPRVTAVRDRLRLRAGSDHADRVDDLLFKHERPDQAFSALVVIWFFALACSSGAEIAALGPSTSDWMSRPGHHRKADEHPHGTGVTNPAEPVPEAPSSTTPPTQPLPASEPPPGDGCSVHPGTGIPDKHAAERTDLAAVWTLLGEPNAGCAELAVRVESTAVFTVLGVCPADDGERALAVVGPGHPAAILMANPRAGADPVAAARRFADDGSLRGASPRTRIATGDAQILFTSDGTWVLVRPEQSDGHGGVKSVPKHCAEVKPGGGAYALLPPALAQDWLVASAALGIRTWPLRNPDRDGTGTKAYVFRSARDGTAVATAWCQTSRPHRCELHADGLATIVDDDTTAAPIDVQTILRDGPVLP